MTGPQPATLAVLLGGVITVPVLAVARTGSLARLRFRSRIEAVRADAVTAFLNRRLGRDPVVGAYLTALDRLARDARWATVRLIAEALAGDHDDQADCPACQELPSGEQEVMTALLARTLAAISGYLAWGNPLIWPWTLAQRAAHTARRAPRRPNR